MAGTLAEYLIGMEPGSFTFAMVKPDTYVRHINEILHIIDLNGLKIQTSFMGRLTPLQVRGLYYNDIGKEYYEPNLQYLLSGKVYGAILTGPNALLKWRSLMGPTDSSLAHPDTLRGMFGNPHVIHENAVHGSHFPVSALRECLLFFEDLKNAEC